MMVAVCVLHIKHDRDFREERLIAEFFIAACVEMQAIGCVLGLDIETLDAAVICRGAGADF